jgi:hypothetical protein
MSRDVTPISMRDSGNPAPNQHDPGWSRESVSSFLYQALSAWEAGGCDCCSPTVLDDAIDELGYDPEMWARFRRFGIELAQTAQSVIDDEARDA